MFSKKRCKRCNEKIDGKYRFCPNCGIPLNEEEDWGMLGKEDSRDEFDEFSNQIFGGISGKMLNKMFGSAMRMLEKEMQKEMKAQTRYPRTNFELFINGKRIDPRNIRVTKKPLVQNIPIKKRISIDNFSKKSLENFSKLPKQEPSTNVRRFSNKVIYEIELPGVKTIKDISIVQLENSIEIKAVSKDKSYFKSIPINMPITNYALSGEKLFLELEVGN